MRKLRGLGPGDPMPQGGAPLSPDILFMIDDWIRRGAHSTAEECPPATSASSGGGGHLGGVDGTICDDTPVTGDYVWEPEPPLPAPAPNEGMQLYVPPHPVPPGTEWELCYAFRPDFTGLPTRVISRQTYRMHEGSHHLLLYMYFGDNPEAYAQGYFPCQAGNCTNRRDCPADSGTALIPIGGTQVAGTQYEVSYPPGVGLPVLNFRKAVFIANLHYTNPFQPAQDIYSEAWLNLYFHKPGEYKAMLDGIFAINSQDLVVEPYTSRTISRLWRPRSILTGLESNAAVFQLFGHMHKRGREFTVDFVDRYCAGDCNTDNLVTIDEVLTGVAIALGTVPYQSCVHFDRNRDDQVSVEEIVAAVDVALTRCQREPETQIYRTTEWDNAPIQEYAAPYLLVDRDQGLRWSCTHENGRLLPDGQEDPAYPAKKCHAGCDACGWHEASRTCRFRRDGVTRTYREGEPMPLAFGLLADDDMCNMFGYYLQQEDLAKLPQ
jgi:hypothetical protein